MCSRTNSIDETNAQNYFLLLFSWNGECVCVCVCWSDGLFLLFPFFPSLLLMLMLLCMFTFALLVSTLLRTCAHFNPVDSSFHSKYTDRQIHHITHTHTPGPKCARTHLSACEVQRARVRGENTKRRQQQQQQETRKLAQVNDLWQLFI